MHVRTRVRTHTNTHYMVHYPGAEMREVPHENFQNFILRGLVHALLITFAAADFEMSILCALHRNWYLNILPLPKFCPPLSFNTHTLLMFLIQREPNKPLIHYYIYGCLLHLELWPQEMYSQDTSIGIAARLHTGWSRVQTWLGGTISLSSTKHTN
jgi:hypothetical protein